MMDRFELCKKIEWLKCAELRQSDPLARLKLQESRRAYEAELRRQTKDIVALMLG